MKKLNNSVCLSLFLLLANSSVFAEDLKAKLKGGIEFQSGFNKNNGPKSQRYISRNKEGFAFNSSANFSLNIENKIENSFEYGAKIGVETTARNDRRVASSLYMISNYGKVELGSEKSANAKMKITGSSVACGTGGAWDSWVTLPRNAEYVSFITNNGSYLDAKTREMTKAEYSRKITYYTPEYKGLQFGISYVADTTNTGYTVLDQPVYHAPVKLSPYYHSMRDGFAYGATYEYKASEDVKVKTAFVGEKAKVDSFLKSNRERVKTRFTDLNTYTFGAELHCGQYSVAGSYSNHLKSITSDSTDSKDRDSEIYSIGGRYKHNKFATSLSLFTSDHKKNKVNAVTLASEYKLAPGLLPYGEVTSYRTNGIYIRDNKRVKDNIEGVVILLGMKLEI